MTREVKLHILHPDHAGPVVYYPDRDGPALTRPRIAGNGYLLARMAYAAGTLYTDTPPDQWRPVDHDRAAALGYGPSEPWPEFPAPDFIKPGPVTQYLNPKVDSMIRLDPAQQLQALEDARQKRQWRISILNTRIYPQYEATLSSASARVTEGATGRVFGIPFHVFDALTIEQLVHRIQTHMK